MKILQINSVYNEGSTGKLVQYIHSGLKQRGIETVVCYGNGAVSHEKNIYRISNKFNQKIQAIISRVTGIMYGGCIYSTFKLINIIKKEKPDVVHLQCIIGKMKYVATNALSLLDSGATDKAMNKLFVCIAASHQF